MGKDKRASSKDVAKEAGVSQATVSYVLNNVEGVKIKHETREAVLQAAKKLNYHPDLIARSMRLKKAMSIGIVSDKSISSFMFMNVLEGIKEALVTRNYTMTLCLNKAQELENADHIKYYSSNRIDGIIFAYSDLSQEHIDYLTENNIPYVVIHTNVKNEMNHLVKTDMSAALYDAVRHLKEKFGSRIGYIGVTSGNLCSPRYRGYQNALRKCCIEPNPSFELHTSGDEEELFSALEDYFNSLETPPDAILCDSANGAFSLFKYASRRGIRIPEDMAVVAIGTSNFASHSIPTLSAIEAPLYDMGFTGCNMLFDVMKNKTVNDVVVLEWKFISRDSG